MNDMERDMIRDIIERRSCKSYKPDPVPWELVDQVIEAGLHAASGLNRQSGKILAVTNREIRDRLSALNAKYDPKKRPDPFYNAPVVLVVFADRSEPMGIYDGSLMLGNMMMAAKALGLGSCWIHRAAEVLDDPEGKEILQKAGLTGSYIGIGNLVLGWPEVMPEGALKRKEERVYRLD